MPSYDFRCNSCGNRFSLTTSVEGRKNVRCPECTSPEVTQLLSGFFFAKSGGNGNGASAASSGSSCGGSCAGCSGC